MQLIKLKPKTPGTRHQIKLNKNLLAKKNTICKKLIFNIPRSGGRSPSTGHITMWHRGGGCKKLFRKIEFNTFFTKNIVLFISYDPFRNYFISLCFDFINKDFFFIPSTHTTFAGSIQVANNLKTELVFGNRNILKHMPIGSIINNLTIAFFGSSKYSRSAGTFSQIVQKKENFVFLKLSSGKIISLIDNNFGTFGRVSNLKQNLIYKGKAGRNRNLGFRPIVRGVAMNPVDHPHGGRTKGGRPSVTPWGLLTKGKPTVKKYV